MKRIFILLILVRALLSAAKAQDANLTIDSHQQLSSIESAYSNDTSKLQFVTDETVEISSSNSPKK